MSLVCLLYAGEIPQFPVALEMYQICASLEQGVSPVGVACQGGPGSLSPTHRRRGYRSGRASRGRLGRETLV